MKQIIMEAFIKGFAGLVSSFFREVARHGLSIILLTLICCGLILYAARVENKLEGKLETVNSQWSAALNEARREISATNKRLLDCERDKYDLSIRVAVLEYTAAKNKKR